VDVLQVFIVTITLLFSKQEYFLMIYLKGHLFPAVLRQYY